MYVYLRAAWTRMVIKSMFYLYISDCVPSQKSVVDDNDYYIA